MLERRLADADVSQEDQMNVLKYLEQKETEYMHLQRHKMGVDDFQLLTIIGRGAFGEVLFLLARCMLLSVDLFVYIKCIGFILYLLRKNAGENLQREIYWACVCHEKAQEIGDAPKRPGTSLPVVPLLFHML